MYLLFLACGLGGGEILTVSFISGENLENKENKPQIMELRDQVSLYFHLSFVDLRLVNWLKKIFLALRGLFGSAYIAKIEIFLLRVL